MCRVIPAALVVLLFPVCLMAAEPLEFTVGEFTFERPEGWSRIAATSAMRKAQLAVKNEAGAVADVVFFHFGPGQGGSVDANVQRWIAQFQDATSSSRKDTSSGKSVTFVEAEGTFLSGMPGTPSVPMEGFALRGAILESPQGGDVYVKMTGPTDVVKSAAEAFEKMVLGARPGTPTPGQP